MACSLPAACGLPDAALVARIAAGDTPLFAALVRRHNQLLYRAVRAVVGQDGDSDEALEQAHLAIFERLGDLNGARIRTALLRIALDASHPPAPSRRRPDAARETAKQPAGRVAQARMRDKLVRSLERAVDALPPGCRVVFVLRDCEAMSAYEVSEALELSVSEVTRLHERAREYLHPSLFELVDPTELFGLASWRCDRTVLRVMRRVLAEPLAHSA